MKRIISIICIIALVCSLGNVAMAADTTATVLRLESAEGTVTITNAAGRSLTATSNMRLMNGYTITTGAASYAYVSLDSTKVVKLDALSSCTIRQQGNKLELLLETGQLFFNVTEPLATNETLTIRTSTMATGVRGTSGVVWSDGVLRSGTRLHTGAVTVTTINTDAIGLEEITTTTTTTTAIVVAGQEAISTRYLETGETDLEIVQSTAEDYSGFELDAIANEEGLAEEILENGDTPLTQELLDDAQTLLEQEQETQLEQEETVQAEQESQTTADDTTQAETVTATSSSSSSSSSGSSSGSSTTTDDATTVTTFDELTAALDEGGANVVIAGTITATDNVDVASDGTLTIEDGATLDMSTYILTVEGTLELSGDITGALNGVLVGSASTSSYSLATDDGSLYSQSIQYAATTPTVNITGGSITMATNALSIYSGTVNMTSGSKVTTSGGFGVYLYDGATFTMTGGSVSALNTSSTVGVNVDDGATFTMTGGLIEAFNIAVKFAEEADVTISDLDSDSATDTPSIRSINEDVVSFADEFTLGRETTTSSEAQYSYYFLLFVDDGGDSSTTSVTITPNSWSDVTTALATHDNVTIASNVTMTGDDTVPAGVSLKIATGVTLDLKGFDLTTNGYLFLYGTISDDEDGTGGVIVEKSTTATTFATFAMGGDAELTSAGIPLTVKSGYAALSGGTITATGTSVAISLEEDGSVTFSGLGSDVCVRAKNEAVVNYPDTYTVKTVYNSVDYYSYLTSASNSAALTWTDVAAELELYNTYTITSDVELPSAGHTLEDGQSLTIGSGGTVTVADGGAGLTVPTGAALTIASGGTLEADITTIDGHLLNITGGTVTTDGKVSNGAPSSMAIYMIDGGLTITSGASVYASKAQAISAQGSSTLTISGGAITSDMSSTDYGIVDIGYSVEATMSGGNITATASSAVNNIGTFTLSGGTLAYDGTVSDGQYALNNQSTGTFTMTNGTVMTDAGYAIYNAGSMSLGTLGTDASQYCVVCSLDEDVVYSSGTVYEGAKSGSTDYYYLTSYTAPATLTWSDVTTALSGGGTYTLTQAVSIESACTLSEGATLIIGDGGILNATGSYGLTIGGGGTLTVQSGGQINTSADNYINISADGAVLTVENGGTIAADSGASTAPVHMSKGAMYVYGTVSSDSASYGYEDKTVIYMTGGKLTLGDTSSDTYDYTGDVKAVNGYGIYMAGGELDIVLGNITTGTNYETLYVADGAQVTMTDGTITATGTTTHGVHNEGTFVMNGGTIAYTCTSSEAAAYAVKNTGSFTINGGTVSSSGSNAYNYAIHNTGTLHITTANLTTTGTDGTIFIYSAQKNVVYDGGAIAGEKIDGYYYYSKTIANT